MLRMAEIVLCANVANKLIYVIHEKDHAFVIPKVWLEQRFVANNDNPYSLIIFSFYCVKLSEEDSFWYLFIQMMSFFIKSAALHLEHYVIFYCFKINRSI